ncbi:MAG: potassium transporter [Vicingaceae bacterium]|nr:MAG: potassium transporter [Vicingaceae bacterium]
MKVFINRIRERINLFLYPSKERNLSILRKITFLLTVTNILAIIYYYGFELTDFQKRAVFLLMQITLGYFIFRFFVRFLYDFHPKEFFKENFGEFLLVVFLFIEGISYNLYGTLIIERFLMKFWTLDYKTWIIGFTQVLIIIFLFTQIIKKSNFKSWFKIHPALLFTLSITTLTLFGAALLMLPKMNVDGHMSWIDALFLSMSSVSVTGLSTIDISQELTLRGQIVIIILMQLGGLNTIAFGALLLIAYKFGVKIKFHEVVEDFINSENILATDSMLGKIVKWTLIIETLGFFALFFSFGNHGIFANLHDKIFFALFHAISGFNNAGLSIFPGGMMHPDVIDNLTVHGIILTLFFLGGFGMIYLFDLLEWKNIKKRMKYHWVGLDFGTKISLYFTLGLLFFGAIIFIIFEWHNTLEGLSIGKKILFSLYESMTTRNAGFNVVDTASLSLPVLIIFFFLMFVGASSGSAGGGIRTSTFAIIWASVRSIIKSKRNVELFHRTIPNDLVLKAYAILIFFCILNVVGIFVLSISEQNLLNTGEITFLDIVFEHISAASTVGLSTGITAKLSITGKLMLIVAMFIGRVGTLTIAYLVSKEAISVNYKYPYGHTMVG